MPQDLLVRRALAGGVVLDPDAHLCHQLPLVALRTCTACFVV
jgi:hypothetical protein